MIARFMSFYKPGVTSLVPKTGRAISLFPHFCFRISTRYKNKCGGDLSKISGIYTRDLPQHVHNTERTRMQKAKTNQSSYWAVEPQVWLTSTSFEHLHRDGLCTLPLILSPTYDFKWKPLLNVTPGL